MHRCLLLVFGCLTALGGTEGQAVEALTLEELVQALPPAPEQIFWDFEKKDFHIAPPVAELKRRLSEGATLTDESWRTALVRSGALRVRERWLAGQPFAVSMDVPYWLGDAEIRATPRVAEWESAVAGDEPPTFCGNCASGRAYRWSYQELGPIDLGRHEIVFDVSIEHWLPARSAYSWRRDRDAPAGPTLLWRSTIAFQVEVVDRIEEIVPRIEAPEIDRALAGGLLVSFDESDQGRCAYLHSYLHLDLPELAAASCVLDLEFLRDGVVWSRAEWTVERRSPFRAHVPLELPAELESSPEARSAWSVRVTGVDDGMHALRNFREFRYAGSFVVPLETLFRESTE